MQGVEGFGKSMDTAWERGRRGEEVEEEEEEDGGLSWTGVDFKGLFNYYDARVVVEVDMFN